MVGGVEGEQREVDRLDQRGARVGRIGATRRAGVVGRVERHPPVREPHPEAAVAQDGRAGLVGGDGVDAGAAAGHAARLRRRGAQPGVGRVGVEAPGPVHEPGDGVAAQRQGEAAGAHHGDARAQAEVGAPPRHRPPCHRWGCLIRRHCVVASSDGRRVPAVPWRTGRRPPVRSVTSGPLDRAGPGAEGENGRPHDATGPPTGPTRQEAGRDEHQRGSTPVHRGRHRSGPPAPLLGARRGLVVLRSARRDADPRRPRPPAVGRPGRRPGLPARGRTPGRDRPRSRSARCPTTPPRAPTSSSPSTSSAPARSAPC